jgi:PAS domain S-box-containing protein
MIRANVLRLTKIRSEQMAGSLEPFEALIENSPDVISLVDPNGQVLYASASTAKVLGYQPEELLGRNGLDLLHPHDRDYSVRSLQQVLVEPQEPQQMQARVRQKNGQWLWVESTACNLLDEPRVGAILLNYREISRRRAADEERQRQADELARANTELKAFAYTAAHDLTESLRTISAFTQLLVRKAQLAEDEKEIARFIVDGVRRMSTLLDHLLSSATRRFNASLRPVQLEQAAAEAITNLREALSSSSAAVTVEPLPTVQADECDLVRLFQNLISNAVKYRSESAVEVHITAERSGSDWVIRVRDNGIGIAKENHRSVFGLFRRMHSETIPGTGMGLAVCKKIVEGLGGTIWVESEPGSGSTFCFTLAVDHDKSEIAAAADVGTGSQAMDS